MTSVHRALRVAHGRIPGMVALAPPPGVRPLPGKVLLDEDWLAARVADARGGWPCPDDRVAGTLWWYSASSVLLAPTMASLLVTGTLLTVEPEALTVWIRSGDGLGDLGGAVPARAGSSLWAGLGAVIAPLARRSGATERSLWAVASDSLANRALDAGRALGELPRARALAVEVAAAVPPMPAPRFHQIPGARNVHTYVRRASCCLIYATPGMDKCASCPRQRPEVRAGRLRANALTRGS